MKTSYIFSTLLILTCTATLHAAPEISAAEVTESALRNQASPAQLLSLDAHATAKIRAHKKRVELAQKAKEITADNNAGMKKTILRRTLNNMMPDCEREEETPRRPNNYEVR